MVSLNKTFFIVIVLSAFLSSCGGGGSKTQELKELASDPHSFANFNEARINHIDLDLAVDFDEKKINGKAKIFFGRLKKTDQITLDTRMLSINGIILDNGKEAKYVLGDEVDLLGRSLSIEIEPETKYIEIDYTTDTSAAALMWLDPSLTSGKKHPFMFSQSQAVLARTWIPCQDGPGVKFTYNATVRTSPELLALMSAENPTTKSSDGVYTFKMEQPISSYLLALAVGDMEFESTGRNSGVYAEPDMLAKSVWEFSTMQSMIDSAEALYGDYVWGRYDVLVLPPSFPFGGMENPRLTFATPTIIAGDRSLVALIAHELAHSWSGNLVTNETWNDFWLNEGFTVYFEQRIMEKVYGKNYADMLFKLGKGDLEKTIVELEEDNKKADTHLFLDLKDRDPDDGLTDVAYEKGRLFLQTIEEKVGRERFDVFLKDYFTSNSFKTMETANFISLLNKDLLSEVEQKELMIDKWIYGPGIPHNAAEPSSAELDRVELAISKFNNDRSNASGLDTSGYTSHHLNYFLRGLKNLNLEKMHDLDQMFGFTQSGNSEVLCEWFKRCIDLNYQPAYPAMKDFLVRVGRRKFLTPLYTGLSSTPENKEWALEVYKEARPGYHSVSYGTIDKILNYK